MRTRRVLFISFSVLVALGLLKFAVPMAQRWSLIWLVLVSTAGPWIVWDCAKKLYIAAMEGFFVTDLYGKVHRETEPRLFRNNVIIHIIILPIITVGFVTMLLNALSALQVIG